MGFKRITALQVRRKRVVFIDAEFSSFALRIDACPNRELMLLKILVIPRLRFKLFFLLFKRETRLSFEDLFSETRVRVLPDQLLHALKLIVEGL